MISRVLRDPVVAGAAKKCRAAVAVAAVFFFFAKDASANSVET